MFLGQSAPAASSPASHPRSWKSLFNFTAFAVWSLILWVSAGAAVWSGLFKPYTLDETDITERAWLLNARGVEPFLKGEHYFAHPPFYEYVVAWIIRAAGSPQEWILRGFGLLVFVGVMALLVLILNTALRDEPKEVRRTAAITALSLCIASPYLVQHSLLIDADTTGTVFFLTLFFWGFVRFEVLSGWRFAASRLVLAVIFALLFWSKEVTPIPAAAGFLAYRVLRGQWKRGAADLILVFLAGTALAWGVWLVYCAQTGVEPMTFIRYTLMKKTSRALDPRHIRRVFLTLDRILRWPVYWATVPFMVWAVVSSVKGVMRLIRRRAEVLDACWVVGWAIFLPYIIGKPTIDMMKYQHPALVLWIAVMSADFARSWRAARAGSGAFSPTGKAWPWMLAILLILGTHYYSIGDYLLWMWDSASLPHFKEFVARYHLPLIAGLAGVGILCFVKKKSFGAMLLAGCLVSATAIGSALHWRQTTPYTTVESWMNYGEGGFRETLEYLRAHLKTGDLVVLRKDFMYYLKAQDEIRVRNLDVRQVFLTRDPEGLMKLFGSGVLRYVIINKIEFIGLRAESMGPAMKVFSRFYSPALKTKSFTVYRHLSIKDA